MIVATLLVVLVVQRPAPGAPDGQWPMPAKGYAATRYSALTQITAANAKALRAAWSFSTGVLAGHEGQPLVVHQTMYVATPYPNARDAFDLAHDGAPLAGKTTPTG